MKLGTSWLTMQIRPFRKPKRNRGRAKGASRKKMWTPQVALAQRKEK
jgi:hypothetical protein